MRLPTPIRHLRTVLVGVDPPLPPPRGRFARLIWALPVLMPLLTFLLALSAAAAADQWGGPYAIIASVAGVAPLALLPRRTLLAWRIAAVVALLVGLIGPISTETAWPWSAAQFLVLLVLLFAVGLRHGAGVLIWVWVASSALVWAFAAPGNRPGLALLYAALLALPYLLSRRSAVQLRLAQEQERSALLTERARIARELHDVVAHHMSMIAVRAETAPYRLGDLAEPVRTEFAEIADAARQSLTETRRLLGVLRSDGDAAPTGPQPGLGDLPALVDAARSAGTEVTLETDGDIDGDWAGMPPAVDVSGYRIVQEALSNAARHAAGAAVRVSVQRAEDRLTIRVTNRPGRPGPAPSGPTHGLRGMRERVSMLDGELAAAPTGDGGFEVHALLPLPPGPAGPPAHSAKGRPAGDSDSASASASASASDSDSDSASGSGSGSGA